MERRHEEQLLERMESAYLHGHAFVSWSELYLWYDVQKIAARTWRDINRRWQEVTGDEKLQLLVLNKGDGIHLFPSKTRAGEELEKLSDKIGMES